MIVQELQVELWKIEHLPPLTQKRLALWLRHLSVRPSAGPEEGATPTEQYTDYRMDTVMPQTDAAYSDMLAGEAREQFEGSDGFRPSPGELADPGTVSVDDGEVSFGSLDEIVGATPIGESSSDRSMNPSLPTESNGGLESMLGSESGEQNAGGDSSAWADGEGAWGEGAAEGESGAGGDGVAAGGDGDAASGGGDAAGGSDGGGDW